METFIEETTKKYKDILMDTVFTVLGLDIGCFVHTTLPLWKSL
jgi:hypothetical protein